MPENNEYIEENMTIYVEITLKAIKEYLLNGTYSSKITSL